MTDIEALRARMRETAGSGFDYLEVPASDCLALDAEITRLREDLDRVTRERDEALMRADPDLIEWAALVRESKARAEAAEAALAKRDEEVARLRLTVGHRDRRIARLVSALNDARGQGFRVPADDEPTLTASTAITQEPTNA